MENLETSRPADLGPSSRSSRRVALAAVVLVAAAGVLRLIAPLTQYARSGRKDTFDLWIALAVPIAILVVVGILVVIRISPWLRQRRLHAAHPNAVMATGQWVDETRAAVVRAPTGGQMQTYTLVIERDAVTLHSGSAKSTSIAEVPAGDIVWIHTALERMWQRSRATLVVTTTTGTIPLLLVDFSRPISLFMAPNELGKIAAAARILLELGGDGAD